MLALSGDLDVAGATELGAYFDALLALGHLSVAVELSALDLMGPAGLTAIGCGASRLVASGGVLTIRAASERGTRTLDATWLGDLVRLELPGPSRNHLGPEQSVAAPWPPVRSDPASLFQNWRGVTATPADDDVVDGALRLVVHLARVTVAGAHGVSVSLRRHGRLATVVASDQAISDIDADQYATGEGPCADASVNEHWFHVESLDQETRWPAFVPRAKKLGINAILSTPPMARSQPVGALDIYFRTRAVFAAKDQELASVFATEASAILTDRNSARERDLVAGTGAATHLVPDAQREHPEQGCPPAEPIAVLPVKRSRVVRRRGRRRVQLGSPGTAATLALPSHGGALCGEPEAMPEDPARHHGIDRSRARRGAGCKGPRHCERARTRIAPEQRTAKAATWTRPEILWS